MAEAMVPQPMKPALMDFSDDGPSSQLLSLFIFCFFAVDITEFFVLNAPTVMNSSRRKERVRVYGRRKGLPIINNFKSFFHAEGGQPHE